MGESFNQSLLLHSSVRVPVVAAFNRISPLRVSSLFADFNLPLCRRVISALDQVGGELMNNLVELN